MLLTHLQPFLEDSCIPFFFAKLLSNFGTWGYFSHVQDVPFLSTGVSISPPSFVSFAKLLRVHSVQLSNSLLKMLSCAVQEIGGISHHFQPLQWRMIGNNSKFFHNKEYFSKSIIYFTGKHAFRSDRILLGTVLFIRACSSQKKKNLKKKTLVGAGQRNCDKELTLQKTRSQQQLSRHWCPMPTYVSTPKKL